MPVSNYQPHMPPNKEKTPSSGLVQLAPVLGVSLGHNMLQGFLLNRSVCYLSNPTLNLLLNLPVSVACGSVASYAAKALHPDTNSDISLRDLVHKSITWGTVFNTLSALSLFGTSLRIDETISHFIKDILGPVAITTAMVASSVGLSYAIAQGADKCLLQENTSKDLPRYVRG